MRGGKWRPQGGPQSSGSRLGRRHHGKAIDCVASILIPCFALYRAANLRGLKGWLAASFGAIAGDLIDWFAARNSQSFDLRMVVH